MTEPRKANSFGIIFMQKQNHVSKVVGQRSILMKITNLSGKFIPLDADTREPHRCSDLNPFDSEYF